MIKVYQIRLTDAEVDAINRDESFPKATAFFSRSFDAKFKAENFQYYTHVANVDSNDMEEAFRAMNLWDDTDGLVKKIGPCSSMSVGDILELEDGSKYRCASFGFTQLENYQVD
jgi:hypothetical protein